MEIPKFEAKKILSGLALRIAATKHQSNEPERADALATALFDCVSYLEYHEDLIFEEEERLHRSISYAEYHNIY